MPKVIQLARKIRGDVSKKIKCKEKRCKLKLN